MKAKKFSELVSSVKEGGAILRGERPVLRRFSTDVVTVSSRFQIVVIPVSIRRQLGLKPGQKLQVVQSEGRIELIPIVPTKSTRGFLKALDTTIERDDDRT